MSTTDTVTDTLPAFMPITANITTPAQPATEPVALFALISDTLAQWQIHRCHVTDGFIGQEAPMKLIYHYEQLDAQVKAAYPLQGNLLLRFDEMMSREQFAKLLGVPLEKVAAPWQMKFVGKLVAFLDSPEIALRLQWVNTLKAFEPVYQSDLSAALSHAFTHWQFVGNVEIISKSSQAVFQAAHPDLAAPWQLVHGQGFVTLPSVLGLSLQQFLHEHAVIRAVWLTQLQSAAQDYAQTWQTKFEH